MTSTVEFGEVCICLFPYTSGLSEKARPVLVLMDLDVDCLICRITSVPYREFLDLPVVEWREAGLEKPSTIRLSRLVTVEKTLLKTRIGRLRGPQIGFTESLLAQDEVSRCGEALKS